MIDRRQIIHWTLSRDDRRLTCVERSIPDGLECSVLYDGLPVAVRVAQAGPDVEAWAAHIRTAWEAAGWLSVEPGRQNARAAELLTDEEGSAGDRHVHHAFRRIGEALRDRRATDAPMPAVGTC